MESEVLELCANRVLSRCTSTNDVAKKLAEHGYPHGTWVSTQVQELGRGRLGRKWESLEGNLFLSIVARIENKSVWSWVPLATAIGVTRLLRSKYSDLDVRVKWPNDIWLRDSKLGGILCEASPYIHMSGTVAQNAKSPYIVIGIGLNCLHSPDALDQETINLTKAQGGKLITANLVRLPVVSSVVEELDRLALEGPAFLKEAYQSWAAFPTGIEVKWGSSKTEDKAEQTGFVHGLGSSGELLVKNSEGMMVSLFAEDVRLKYHSESIL